MKSGEDFRRALGQADDGFVRVITQVLSDLRIVPKAHPPRRRRSRAMASGRDHTAAAPYTPEA